MSTLSLAIPKNSHQHLTTFGLVTLFATMFGTIIALYVGGALLKKVAHLDVLLPWLVTAIGVGVLAGALALAISYGLRKIGWLPAGTPSILDIGHHAVCVAAVASLSALVYTDPEGAYEKVVLCSVVLGPLLVQPLHHALARKVLRAFNLEVV